MTVTCHIWHGFGGNGANSRQGRAGAIVRLMHVEEDEARHGPSTMRRSGDRGMLSSGLLSVKRRSIAYRDWGSLNFEASQLTHTMVVTSPHRLAATSLRFFCEQREAYDRTLLCGSFSPGKHPAATLLTLGRTDLAVSQMRGSDSVALFEIMVSFDLCKAGYQYSSELSF